MIRIKEFFTAAGLEVAHHWIKLVRHTDHMSRSMRQIIADGIFDRYQAEQHEHIAPFKDCDVILTFIATEGKLAEFHGAYRVGASREFRKDDFLNLPDYLMIGHGGNKVLMGLDCDNFQWSIVRTLSGVISKVDVIHIEYLEKKKHGTRASGLDYN